ncbi:MAG TPA: hypothetical protein VE553_01125, partial [Candidatus Binatia bacterium]|nr:hypothetical protein [Candidatus Binatia bacterium]
MKTRLSLLMVLILVAALIATPLSRAHGNVAGGLVGAGGRQTFALPPGSPVSWTGQPAGHVAAAPKGSSAAYSHAGQSPSESWLISWDASTSGGGVDGSRRVNRQSHLTASVVVNFYSDDSSEYYANGYTGTYLVEYLDDYDCDFGGHYRNYLRWEVADPARYNGDGPVAPNTIMTYKPMIWTGTKLTINVLNLALDGLTTDYRHDRTICDGETEHERDSTPNSFDHLENLTSAIRSPFNSDDDGLFLYEVDTQIPMYEAGVAYSLHVEEHLRVERLSGRNLRVRDIEVTQGLQLHNTIPLVQGRRTIVRAYIDIGTEPGPIAGVTGRLRVYSGGTLLGELEPFNMAGAISAKRAPDWQQIDDTLNFELPWLWTQAPALRFEVEVNHTGQVDEIDYTDNTRSVELPLRDCKPLMIGYLPIRFAPPNVTPSGPGADISVAHEWMRKVYPVADDELLYWPVPGMTWTKPIDDPDPDLTWANAVQLLSYLDDLLLLTYEPDIDRLVGWLPSSASQQMNGLAYGVRGQVAFATQKKAPRNLWRATLAHELGHTYGLNHTTATTRGYHWFDIYERSIKP